MAKQDANLIHHIVKTMTTRIIFQHLKIQTIHFKS